MKRCFWLTIAILCCGCGKDAERLSNACKVAATKLDSATGGARAKLAHGWQAARGEAGVDSRVGARLRWDKYLEGADIQVRLVDGVVQLEGTIASPDQEQHALDVANATRGVDRVESKLQVR